MICRHRQLQTAWLPSAVNLVELSATWR